MISEGTEFEASVRIEPAKVELLKKGQEAKVNGQDVKGPIHIFRKNLVSEVSFVLFGADKNTSGDMVKN